MAYYEIAEFLLKKTSARPEVGIICGSGLSGLANTLDNKETIPYEDIPGFPKTSVQGHKGELVFGKIGSVSCVCLRGRFHFYEGRFP
jgi:purine-nucleoside phosphorylase